MRAHLSAVMDHLLFAIEEKAIEDARKAVKFTRERYSRSKKL
jgi:GntR family transcriptional repressor for pyruvate dehydrogenase complex